jgi:hypothetical protein
MNEYVSTLKKIIQNDMDSIQSIDIPALLQFMLHNIGHTDPELRDNLIYSGFCRLILDDYLTTVQLIFLYKSAVSDDYLYYQIHEPNDSDAVFKRSFSALLIQLLLYKDKEHHFLAHDLLRETLPICVEYLKFETDYRGFVEEKGWAHAVAHGSDMLAQAVAHPMYRQVSSSTNCLQALKSCIWTEYAYIDEEDERMLAVLDELLMKDLTSDALINWLEELQSYKHPEHLIKYRVHRNIKKFITSLYIHLLKKQSDDRLCNEIFLTFIAAKDDTQA